MNSKVDSNYESLNSEGWYNLLFLHQSLQDDINFTCENFTSNKREPTASEEQVLATNGIWRTGIQLPLHMPTLYSYLKQKPTKLFMNVHNLFPKTISTYLKVRLLSASSEGSSIIYRTSCSTWVLSIKLKPKQFKVKCTINSSLYTVKGEGVHQNLW